VIFDGQCQLIESNSAIPSFLTSQKDQLLIPGIKDTMNLNIQHLPSQLFCMVPSIRNILLSLLNVLYHLIIEIILIF
jgi:hypothetical protein